MMAGMETQKIVLERKPESMRMPPMRTPFISAGRW